MAPTFGQILDWYIAIFTVVGLHICPKVRVFVESLNVQFLLPIRINAQRTEGDITRELKGRVSMVGYSLLLTLGLYTSEIVAPAMDS